MKTRTFFLTSTITLLLGGFALRLWHLDSESLWHDEGWSIRAVEGPFTTPDDNTPFLYYVAGHLLWRVVGDDAPFVYRYASVLIGIVTVAVGVFLSRRWFGLHMALVAGVLIAINPLLWDYAQEVRAYVAVPLIALLMLYGAGLILRYPKGERVPLRVWGFVFVVEVAGLYTHNLSVPLIVWLNVALGIAWLWRRDFRRMVTWAGWQIALIVAYIPWLLTQAPSGTPLNTPPQIGFALVRDIWASYFLPVLPQLQDALAEQSTLLALILALGVVGSIAVIANTVIGLKRAGDVAKGDLAGRPYEKSTLSMYLLLTHALFVPVFSTALMLAAHIDFHPRYYIAAVPGTLILLAVALDRGISPVKMGRVVLAGVTLSAVLISAWSIHQIRTTRQYQHDDFQAIADYYAALPEEARVLIPFNDEPILEYVFADEIGAGFVNVPLYSDEATAFEAIAALSGRHIELLTWYQLPADPRGMYGCLIGALSASNTEPFTVFGLSTQGYDLPQTLPDFEAVQVGSPYREVGLQSAAVLAGEGGVCLRTTWTLNQPMRENVQVAASILNPFGAPIARMDGEIARDDNAGTSNWEQGELGSAYHLLRLPEGAPAGDYDLLLNVYTPAQPSGFDVLDEGGNPAGKDYRVTIEIEGVTVDFTETRLLGDVPEIVQTGIPLELTLQIDAGSSDSIVLSLAGEDWSQDETLALEGDQLVWVRFTVPPGNDGDAQLLLDGEQLAIFTVLDPPRTFEAPTMPISLEAVFGDFAVLTGADFATEISVSEPFSATLLWESTATPDTSYTVFVQLLDPDGRVLAQSDALPAQGERPTTGWVSGEYILDRHTLNWNITDYQGEARLIAGMYDAANGFQRVITENDADRVEIGTVMVIP